MHDRSQLLRGLTQNYPPLDGQERQRWQDAGDTYSGERPSPHWALLRELLTSAIVLQEDLEKLPQQAQQDLEQCGSTDELLAMLIQSRLLTPYQADRVRAATTYGLILGNYRVLERLGAGGMGVVFKGEHVHLRRPVAIKVLSMSSEQSDLLQQRFLMEMRTVAQLQHPNIVSALDAGLVFGPNVPTLRYFVMELVPGEDLEELVLSHGPLSPSEACDLIRQIAAALVEAHKYNLVHRDIKPSNIQVTPDGQAKLLDFGLARHIDARMTEPGILLGSLDYMAPEQMRDASTVDIRADIYGLGGTLFWCLTGRTPFPPRENITLQVAARLTQQPPSVRIWRPEAPAELDAIIGRMMALDPADRFPTPQQVLQALLPFLQSRPQSDAVLSAEHARAAGEGSREHQILIVDDQPELRRFCCMVLGVDHHLKCHEAGDGPACLEALKARRYDLVLLDIDMPGMSGTEVCRQLRESPPCPHLKVVMMSGRATADEMARMLGAGADDYIVKPLAIVPLQSKVKAALALKDAQDRSDLLNSHLLAVNTELERTLNARNSDLVQARNGLLRALANLVDYREGGSGSHLVRMEQNVRCLAGEAATEPLFAEQIDANYIDLLVCCAPLHDIGKVGLPDQILMKPGKLEPDERLLMQTHTTTGAATLRAVMDQHGTALTFLQMAADIARYHHERFDGDGYPDGLAGTAIPLSARLVSICDVYDALRSRRPYKPPLAHAAAVQLITQVSVGQFDPNLLQVFERCAGHFERTFRQQPD
jgi:response regulator RpfG family c-di-GMP phosphodiesterase